MPRMPHLSFTNPTAPKTYALSLHDALPIWCGDGAPPRRSTMADLRAAAHHHRLRGAGARAVARRPAREWVDILHRLTRDRKSTRLNSSHPSRSYAVFCLKKKTMLQSQRHLD